MFTLTVLVYTIPIISLIMVLDINLFRNPETLNIVTQSHVRRYGDKEDIDDLIHHDAEWRRCMFQRSAYSRLENMIKKTIGVKNKDMKANKKKNEPIEESIEDLSISSEQIPALNQVEEEIPYDLVTKIPNIEQEELTKLSIKQLIKISQIVTDEKESLGTLENDHNHIRLMFLKKIGNILDDSVPTGPNDDSSVVVKTQMNVPLTQKPLTYRPHYELLSMIGGVDTKAGSRIAGNRGYFLTGPAVFLGRALEQFALMYMDNKGYTSVQTPVMMNESVMSQVAQLSQFDEELYKIVGSDDDVKDVTKYLIATSEQPLTALHAGEKIPFSNLPIKYVGISQCFRKEAGRHGKDTSGIFRVHQFDKVEQFVICSAEDGESWTHFEELLNNSAEFLDSLKIPYRVVNVASGELNLAAAKKYDIEGFFPGSNSYRELVSCSNCTDYHSRNINTKYTTKKDNNGEYVHMLNSTLCAVTRMICVVLENYQTDTGIIVPEALQAYMPERYREFIQFV